MVPPPPSQAGKFKPRKPAKRVPAPGTASVSAAQSNSTARSSSNGRGGGGRGRGRGRAGRGRGRLPLPKGQVFFTGNTPPASAGKTKSAPKKGSALSSGSSDSTAKKETNRLTIKMEGKHETSDEVIVGELDEGIGASICGSKGEKSVLEQESKGPSKFVDEAASAPDPSLSIAETYGSDSSDDEISILRKQRKGKLPITNKYIQPSQLPFPPAPVPVGVGLAENRPILYEDTDSDAMQKSSPFVDPDNSEAKEKEMQSWFLFQFPTRLPLDSVTAPDAVSSEEIPALAASSQVSIPHILPNSFDNILASNSGHMGKIKVYKSGKTILHMGSTQLNVSEGLPCGFVQHAVAIDPSRATYVPLGVVGKTVVVTPNVQGAFGK